MTIFDESVHPRGQAANAGQFKAKQNTAPGEALDAVQLPVFTPADVRNADHTIEILSDHIVTENVFDFHESGSDEDGNAIVEWKRRSNFGDYVWQERIRVDDAGEVVGVETARDGQWFNQDPYGDELTGYRMKVNEARLAMAGIHINGQTNNGGAYGLKFVGGRVDQTGPYKHHDATAVAKEIRKHIAAAIEWGALPAEYEYRPRVQKGSTSQSITISVEGMPDAKHYVERQEGFAHGQSGHAREIEQVLEAIGEQWNTSDRDYYGDYQSNTYYLHVTVDDEHMAAFRAEQKQIAARKRAARKAAA